MKLATHETYTDYLVVNMEDDYTFEFNNLATARACARELVEVFDNAPRDVILYQRTGDEYGNLISLDRLEYKTPAPRFSV